MSSPSWTKLAVVAASTKRLPALSGGKRGAATAYLASVLVTPLEPIASELRAKLPLSAPHELLQCFVDGSYDVKEGDILVVSAKDYPIEAVADYTWRSGESYRQLTIRDQRTV